jgi:hypothetical protein
MISVTPVVRSASAAQLPDSNPSPPKHTEEGETHLSPYLAPGITPAEEDECPPFHEEEEEEEEQEGSDTLW